MRIVFLSRYQDTIQRGAEVFVNELAKRLSNNNIVEIFSGKKADSIKDVLMGNFNVVVPVNGRIQSLKVSLARLVGKYKVLITGHSGQGWDDIWNITTRPNVFVALTEYNAKWARKWSWKVKIAKIPNGIDLNKFSPAGKKINFNLPRPIILSVGALVWYKHHEKIIDAIARLGKGSLLILGDGPLQENLKKRGQEKLGSRFMITSLPNDEMPNVYRSVDLFSLPSWDREAFGIAYLEALASGIGVVAPDDESRREIIGDGGLFTDTDNSIQYVNTLNQALEIDWSKKAINQARKFSWEKISGEYEKLLNALI